MVRMSGSVPAAGPFDVEGGDARPAMACDRAGHEPGLVERVRVQGDLQPPAPRHRVRAASIAGRGGSPVLVHLVAAGAGERLLLERRRGHTCCPCPAAAGSTGNASSARWDCLRCQAPGVTVVGLGALRRPGATAAERGQAGGSASYDLRRGQEVHVGVEAAGGEDLALAGDHVGARPITRAGSTPSAMSGLPLRPIPTIRPSLMPTSARTMPQWSRITALVMTVSSAPSARGGQRLVHRLADRLAAAEDRLLAAEGEVLLDLDPQVGVAQPDLVSGGRPVQRGVRADRSSPTAVPSGRPSRHGLRLWSAHGLGPAAVAPGAGSREPPGDRAARRSPTVREAPGSNRTDVPGGMSRRKPCAADRSKSRPEFTSGRWICDPIWIGRSATLGRSTRRARTGRDRR